MKHAENRKTTLSMQYTEFSVEKKWKSGNIRNTRHVLLSRALGNVSYFVLDTWFRILFYNELLCIHIRVVALARKLNQNRFLCFHLRCGPLSCCAIHPLTAKHFLLSCLFPECGHEDDTRGHLPHGRSLVGRRRDQCQTARADRSDTDLWWSSTGNAKTSQQAQKENKKFVNFSSDCLVLTIPSDWFIDWLVNWQSVDWLIYWLNRLIDWLIALFL